MPRVDGSVLIDVKVLSDKAKTAISDMGSHISKMGENVSGLMSKMYSLSKVEVSSKNYKSLEKELDKINKEFDKTVYKEKRFLETGGEKDSTAYRRMAYDLSELSNRHSEVIRKMREMDEASGMVVNTIRLLGREAKRAWDGLKNIPKHPIKSLGSAIKGVGFILRNSLLAPLKLLPFIANRVFSRTGKSAKGLTGAFNGGFKTILKYGLGIRSLYVLFNKLRSAIKSGFSNLMEGNVTFANSVNGLKASLATLQNSFAAAFAPIVQMAIPYIQQLVGWLNSAVSAIGQFIAAITGQKAYTRAIKQTAAATEQAADATKDATKAAKGYLSPLDEINKMDKKDTAGGNSSKGGGGAGGAAFEEVPISSKWANIADWFKQMWDKADFTELGTLLGTKLRDALNNIPWEQIKGAARKIGSSIATLINGFVEVDGLGYSIGNTLAQAINTGFTFLDSVIRSTHWDSIGRFIAQTIAGFFQNLDFGKIASAISAFCIGVYNLFTGFIQGINWKEVPKFAIDSIVDFVSNIDWKELALAFGEFFGSALKASIDLISGAIEAIVNAIHEGFKDGLLEGFKNIGKWIWDNIFVPFWNGIKSAFGIHSPSTKMAEIGKYLIEGLKQGIMNAWASFAAFWQEKKNAIINNFSDIKAVFLEKGKAVIDGIRDGILNSWSSFTTFLSQKKNSIPNMFSNIGSIMRNVGINLINGIINGIRAAWNSLASWASSILGMFNIRVSGASSGTRATSGARVSTYSSRQMMMAGDLLSEVPGYATGQVIPRTMREHLARLGDNKKETEVVSPLSTIEEALGNKLKELGFTGSASQDQKITVNVVLDGKVVAQSVVNIGKQRQMATGKNMFELV